MHYLYVDTLRLRAWSLSGSPSPDFVEQTCLDLVGCVVSLRNLGFPEPKPSTLVLCRVPRNQGAESLTEICSEAQWKAVKYSHLSRTAG